MKNNIFDSIGKCYKAMGKAVDAAHQYYDLVVDRDFLSASLDFSTEPTLSEREFRDAMSIIEFGGSCGEIGAILYTMAHPIRSSKSAVIVREYLGVVK